MQRSFSSCYGNISAAERELGEAGGTTATYTIVQSELQRAGIADWGERAFKLSARLRTLIR